MMDVSDYTAMRTLMARSRLTANQVGVLLHTLGYPKCYRNYFAADKNTQDWKDIQQLILAGFMEPYQVPQLVRLPSRNSDSGLQYFRVTEAGVKRMEDAGFAGVGVFLRGDLKGTAPTSQGS